MFTPDIPLEDQMRDAVAVCAFMMMEDHAEANAYFQEKNFKQEDIHIGRLLALKHACRIMRNLLSRHSLADLDSEEQIV